MVKFSKVKLAELEVATGKPRHLGIKDVVGKSLGRMHNCHISCHAMRESILDALGAY